MKKVSLYNTIQHIGLYQSLMGTYLALMCQLRNIITMAVCDIFIFVAIAFLLNILFIKERQSFPNNFPCN